MLLEIGAMDVIRNKFMLVIFISFGKTKIYGINICLIVNRICTANDKFKNEK
tara:strand:- start:328 stop:483 length:156 start_codon:yes stop_codon:yes gene_type:complete